MVPKETELIEQAQHGNMAPFEQLIQRYDERVLSIAATFTNNRDDAKDIYQEVFIRVYKGLPKFQFRSKFSTWIYRVTMNVCLSFTARRKHHPVVSSDEVLEQENGESVGAPGGVPSTDDHVISMEIASRVHEALEKLPPRQKMVFTMRHYEGYKLREIAEMMECGEGTVKRYLFSATRRMREQLREVYS